MKHPLNTIMPIALKLEASLAPQCVEITVAGSLRRGKHFISDIELVAIPRYEERPAQPQRGLFGVSETETVNLLNAHLDELLNNGCIHHAPNKAWGEKMRKFVLKTKQGKAYKVDLFQADHNNYGNILAIRTGPDWYSKQLVTKVRHGGSMPDGMQQKGGYLYRGDELVSCPTERAFFEALGLDWIPARERGQNRPKMSRAVHLD